MEDERDIEAPLLPRDPPEARRPQSPFVRLLQSRRFTFGLRPISPVTVRTTRLPPLLGMTPAQVSHTTLTHLESQPGHTPAPPGSVPAQPGHTPAPPGSAPAQPGHTPAPPGSAPAQPGLFSRLSHPLRVNVNTFAVIVGIAVTATTLFTSVYFNKDMKTDQKVGDLAFFVITFALVLALIKYLGCEEGRRTIDDQN